MRDHFRACLWLLGLSFLLCAVLYPLALWGVGQAFFHDRAEGSLVYAADGTTPVGSRLIGQPFTADEYFWPRPSAAGNGYDASASGGSNLAASNPKLRGRIAQTLGPVVRYRPDGPRKGAMVGPDVEKWFTAESAKGRGLTAEWAGKNPTLAGVWAGSSKLTKAYVQKWADDHPEVGSAWRAANPDAAGRPKPDDLAPFFFTSYAAAHPGTWPAATEVGKDGKKEKQIRPAKSGNEIQSIFFELWLAEHADAAADLDPVPADMVLTSGSGLDPHITLRNAVYQLETRVAVARAAKSGGDRATVREAVAALLDRQAFTPLGGLAGGEPLVNVLEVNRALDALPTRRP